MSYDKGVAHQAVQFSFAHVLHKLAYKVGTRACLASAWRMLSSLTVRPCLCVAEFDGATPAMTRGLPLPNSHLIPSVLAARGHVRCHRSRRNGDRRKSRCVLHLPLSVSLTGPIGIERHGALQRTAQRRSSCAAAGLVGRLAIPLRSRGRTNSARNPLAPQFGQRLGTPKPSHPPRHDRLDETQGAGQTVRRPHLYRQASGSRRCVS